jgi:histidine triad (HIT) family protein
VTEQDAELMERLFSVVQSIAHDVEEATGAAAVLTNLGRYQDSKHLHVHVHSGGLRSAQSPDLLISGLGASGRSTVNR